MKNNTGTIKLQKHVIQQYVEIKDGTKKWLHRSGTNRAKTKEGAIPLWIMKNYSIL